jgi:thiol-disulfide isomerase/thioredoxin
MKHYLIIILLFTISQAAVAQNSWDPTPEKTKPRLEKFTASIDSVICNNETLKGKTVYINFWYAACPACIGEFDALNILYKKLKGTPNFEFISFTYESSDVIEMLIEKYNIKYPVFSLPRADIKKLNRGKGFPTSMIVNEKGEIVYTMTGGNNNKKEARKIIMNEIYPAILKNL